MADGSAGFTMQDDEKEPHVPLRTVYPVQLQDTLPPVRTWRVEGFIPDEEVTANYGVGGVGKTLLAQMLGTSCATGLHWIGLPVSRCRVYGLFCEDSEHELHRRQRDINAYHGIDMRDLADFRWASGKGQDNELVRFGASGRMKLTDRYNDLVLNAKAHGAQLVILDTAADLFGGNENDRRQVRRFVGTTLGRLALDIGGAVLLNAHPSRSGMSTSGDMDGGSTAWSASVRSRLSLEWPPSDDGSPAETNDRILTRRKANYASKGDTIKLTWRNGVLVAQNASVGAFTVVNRRLEIEETFLCLLARALEDGRAISPSKNASNYAAELFGKMPDRRGFTKREFGYAMEALLEQKRIKIVSYGPPSRGLTKIMAASDGPMPDADG